MVDQLLDSIPPAPWIILFSPFVACILIVLFSLKRPRLASTLALTGILISLTLSVFLFWFDITTTFGPAESSFRWLQIAGLSIDFGYLCDPLSTLMLLIVTGVGSCIFLYSTSYMRGDESYPRYFASLSLFAFSMIGIVIANNFLMLFIFWELVAVSSYLLIGFWFQKPSAADAGNKAFIVNRVADFGFVLGIFSVWVMSGMGGGERTFNFTELSDILPALASQGILSHKHLFAAALLIFCGAVGKSAQFPLYIWLPDAMEGPTPVSALIHAATMVAAGVYLLSRSFFLISLSPAAMNIIANIGGITALLAALLAVVQNDIKKILAYSTISQLGYMVMALGLGGMVPGMYHLTTHAFFKALLFLGAGAMIHSLHTQDIWEMGGILRKMPATAVTFIIGTLALCGVFPLSGFFSKDEILALAFERNRVLYAVGIFTAGLTAFYMTRAVWVAVLGHEKAHKNSHGHFHDAPWVMKTPLLILAGFSAIAGFIGIPRYLSSHAHEAPLNMAVALTSTVTALAGIALGTFIYGKSKVKEDPVKKALGGVYEILIKKYYLDEFFIALANVFQKSLAGLLFWFDGKVIMEKGVGGAAFLTAKFSSALRRLQTGNLQNYALMSGIGLIGFIFFALMNRR